MTIEKQKLIARRLAISSGILVFFCSLYLVISHTLATRQAVTDKALVKSMEEAVQMDAAVSIELTAERERQTNRELERDKRNNRVSIVLVIGAAVFLSCMNWRKSLEGDPALSFEKLQDYRKGTSSVSKPLEPRLWPLETDNGETIDLTYVLEIIKQEGTSTDAAVPILRAVQQHYGYLPDEALKRVCELTDISPAQIAGTSSFYAQFRRSPVGKHLARVCHGTACHVSGAVQITEELRRYLAIPEDSDTDPSKLFTLDKVACLGCCSLAPVMMVDEKTVGRLTPTEACRALYTVESENQA